MTTFGIVWLAVVSLGFAVCGWLCVFKTDMLVERGTKELRGTKIRSGIHSFQHGLETLVSYVHTLCGSFHLAMGNRHYLRSAFSSLPLACENHTYASTRLTPD